MEVTAGNDILVLYDQKSLYKHVSDFARLWSFGCLKIRIEGKHY